MDQERINKMEKYLEEHLSEGASTTDYALKKMDVIIKYLIYQQLKELNNNLSLIDEALSISELKK